MTKIQLRKGRTSDPRLDRIRRFDARSRQFPIAAVLAYAAAALLAAAAGGVLYLVGSIVVWLFVCALLGAGVIDLRVGVPPL